MQITIESTSQCIMLKTDHGEVEARVWEGKTKSGIPVHCFISRISPQTHDNIDQFEIELKEQKAPSPEVAAYPLRMIL